MQGAVDRFYRARKLVMDGLVYAGAQKNLGAAGVTIVTIHESLLERSPRPLP